MTVPAIVHEKFGECIISFFSPKYWAEIFQPKPYKWFPLAFLETEDSDTVHRILLVPDGT